METILFWIIVGLVIFEYLLSEFLAYLNTKNYSIELPKELEWIYDKEKYEKSQKYDKEKHKFSLIESTFQFILLMILISFWIFWKFDIFLRGFIIENPILLSLVFFLIIVLIQTILSLPFSYYSTFVIEQKYGFNKSTKAIFFTDFIKSLFLSIIFGGIILFLILFLYQKLAENFWLAAWGVMTFFSLFMMMFYSNIIVPLFNKQTALEEGSLRKAIEDFGKKVGFHIDNIYVIDGSKRSSKANAYFTGLGPKKRIVLFDTLINDMSEEEIVAVLAHEIGHYKKKHTLQMLIFSIIQTGLMLFILSLALKYPDFSLALWGGVKSFHLSLIAFSFLFTPLSLILWILWNMLSRKNEYQADEFSGKNYNPQALQEALKKLSINNLSNLRPHPAYEFFYYSHPTVLKRLQFLENIKKK